jgi:hypothetical protein
MNQGHLSKVWGWLAVASVLFLATTVISLQGGTEFLGRLFGEKPDTPLKNAPGIAYFAVIVGGGLFFLASLPFALHVLRSAGNWAARTPAIWLEGLDTDKWEAKVFQACVLLILVIAPAVGIVKCYLEAETGDICEQDSSNLYRGDQTTLFWAPVPQGNNQMRLRKEDSGDEPCKSGVELFPRSWTPLFFGIVPLFGLIITAFGLVFLFVPRKPKPTTPSAIT